MPKLKNPHLINLVRTIGFEEFVRWFVNKAKTEEHKNLLLFSFITGRRPSEIRKVKSGDIELVDVENILTLKLQIETKKRRKEMFSNLLIPLNEYLQKTLGEYISTTPQTFYLFPSLYKCKNPSDWFMKINKRQNIGFYEDGRFYPLSFYNLRHNLITLMLENGADILDVKFLKGESMSRDLGSIANYIHFSQNFKMRLFGIYRKILKI